MSQDAINFILDKLSNANLKWKLTQHIVTIKLFVIKLRKFNLIIILLKSLIKLML